MDGRHVLEAAAASQALLGAAAGQDWTRRIPEMHWTVAQAVSHMAETTLWYASDLAARERQLDTMELRVPPTTAKADLIRTIGAFATVLARVVDDSPPGARGWHSMGQADASGFAAMADPAVVQRPHRPPRPAPPGPLGLALRPPRGVGRPQPGRPPLTRSRHSSSSIA